MSTEGGAAGLLALKGSTQKPEWVSDRDTNKCHWMFKSYHNCDLSSSDHYYRGTDPQGGKAWTRHFWYERKHSSNADTNVVSLQRRSISKFALQSPYGQVPNHDETVDGDPPASWACIGPDYNVPSEDYLQKMNYIARDLLKYDGTDNRGGLFTRVVGAKHDFYFTNYMRFPVQVLFLYTAQKVQGGSAADPYDPEILMRQLSRTSFDTKLAGAADMDPDALQRISASAESVIIPGTLDNNDMAVTAKHTIKFSPKEYDPDFFAIGPINNQDVRTTWRKVDSDRFGTGQYDADADDAAGASTRRSPWLQPSPDDAEDLSNQRNPQAWIGIYTRLAIPHGHVIGSEEVDMRADDTLQNYRAVDIHVKSSFINEVIGIGLVRSRLNGVQANPANINASS